jgi:hypothetical protein
MTAATHQQSKGVNNAQKKGGQGKQNEFINQRINVKSGLSVNI